MPKDLTDLVAASFTAFEIIRLVARGCEDQIPELLAASSSSSSHPRATTRPGRAHSNAMRRHIRHRRAAPRRHCVVRHCRLILASRELSLLAPPRPLCRHHYTASQIVLTTLTTRVGEVGADPAQLAAAAAPEIIKKATQASHRRSAAYRTRGRPANS